MGVVGIVVEYNPFHNGHLHHLNEVKKLYPNDVIVAALSGNVVQRGQLSLISKWVKTDIAINFGIDIVAEIPFVYANESADFFAENAIKILNNFGVKKIVFGSESNNTNLLLELANIQLNSNEYQVIVNEYIKQGLNYPTACSKALRDITSHTVDLPNDLLGLSYTKAIIKNKFDIEVVTIKRTNDFHDKNISEIASATSIRNAIVNNLPFKIAVPEYTFNMINNNQVVLNEDIFDYLKYRIVTSTLEELREIHLVEEGMENLLLRISEANNLEDFIFILKSKRYTFNRVSRVIMNVLINYKKFERLSIENEEYYRVLGISSKGKNHLKKCDKYFTMVKENNTLIMDIEKRVGKLYNLFDNNYSELNKIVIKK